MSGTAQEKDPNSPASTSAAHDSMLPRWRKMECLLGGTDAMKAAGETYLPKHAAETDEGYRARLQGTVLRNYTLDTLDSLVGKPFSSQVGFTEQVPDAIKALWEDLDQQGNSGDVVLRKWFREGLAKAFSHILVEFPKVEPREDGAPRTLEDDRKANLRPYWVHLCPDLVIDAHAAIIDGREVLTHLRFWRFDTVLEGFVEKTKCSIQVMEPGKTQLWEKVQEKNGKEVWGVVDEWQTGLDFIPLVTFYADRTDFLVGRSPLDDLADLNITHWQSTSEQRHILQVARFPILACSGASKDDGTPVVIGPNKVLYNPEPQGRFYYVEHTGSAIDAGWKDLEKLEQHMSSYGAQFLTQTTGTQTATAKAIDTAEAVCDLVSLVLVFEDAVAKAFWYTAQWLRLGVEGAGTVELEKDYLPTSQDQSGLTELREARKSKEVSRKTYLRGLVARNVLPEDFDAEEDWEELMDEPTSPGAALFNLDSSQLLEGGTPTKPEKTGKAEPPEN